METPITHDAPLPPGDAAFVPVDADRDGPLLGGWFGAEHVRPWWAVPAVGPYLKGALAADHQRSWLVADDLGAFGYVETYRAADDALADHVRVDEGDRGWHVLIGERGRQGTGAADRLVAATVCGLFAEPGVERVLCEPDVRNGRMLGFCARNGGRVLEEFDFGGRKRAALVAWGRDDVALRWPRELAAAEGAHRRWDALQRSAGGRLPAVGAAAPRHRPR
ncbi:GNAT family N-acetyltransferase [Patulibacter minatonensis]|uniref:GNAT family N-acetyltransferase n=1 Tax=Patulibacter minatonensis TaxID=298163 RepID=UPI00047B42BA|nr:GNAT family N-acetyltransferase [Patulibacter minatonensis]